MVELNKAQASGADRLFCLYVTFTQKLIKSNFFCNVEKGLYI